MGVPVKVALFHCSSQDLFDNTTHTIGVCELGTQREPSECFEPVFCHHSQSTAGNALDGSNVSTDADQWQCGNSISNRSSLSSLSCPCSEARDVMKPLMFSTKGKNPELWACCDMLSPGLVITSFSVSFALLLSTAPEGIPLSRWLVGPKAFTRVHESMYSDRMPATRARVKLRPPVAQDLGLVFSAECTCAFDNALPDDAPCEDSDPLDEATVAEEKCSVRLCFKKSDSPGRDSAAGTEARGL